LSPGPSHQEPQPNRTFERTSEQGWGLALGLLASLGLFAATLVPVMRGDSMVAPRLGALSVYLPGYRVTWAGAFIGAAYMFFLGYGSGRVIATIYNRVAPKK
jgi:hypothetical protein